MVSILLSVWCVEWRWCVLLLVYLTQCVWPMPSTPSAHGVSTAAVSRAVCCQVCGVCGACVCLRCLCGGVSLVRSPPYGCGGWGRRVRWGVCCGGGWHSIGRVVVSMATPSVITGIPVCVLVSLSRLCGGLVGWRGVVCVVVPRVCIGSGTFILSCSSFALCCSSYIIPPFSVFAVTARWFRMCLL